MKRLSVILAMVLLAACGGGPAPSTTETARASVTPKEQLHAIQGTLTLDDREAFLRFDERGDVDDETGDFCVAQTTSGYSDIETGMQVVVRNEAGTVLGTARTVGGEVGGVYSRQEKACVWTFTIDEVPTAQFYSIELGRRSGPTYSIDEMDASGWTIDLVIGG